MVSKASAFKSPHNEPTVRLTVAQATVRFLANQYVERDGERSKFFAGCFGIFGHGNVAGMGQALLQAEVEAEQAGTEPGAAICVGPQRAGDGAHRRRVRQAEGSAAGVGRDREHRARLDEHAHRRRAGHHQPAARSAAAVGHLRHPGQRTRSAGPRTAARQRDDRQRRVQAAVAVLRPGVAARTAARRRCSVRCGCSPTRSRPVRPPSRCRRTCRPRRSTGRNRCSPNALGMWPARCRSGR